MPHPKSKPAWRDLLDRYLEVLAAPAGDGEEKWAEVWRLLIGHPWYQAQLRICARRVAGNGLARQLVEDVRQDAMLLLARNLRCSAELRMDRGRVREHFAGWMRTIIRNDCREALRRLRRPSQWQSEPEEGDLVRDEQARMERRLDLELAIARLAEPERTIVTLYWEGLAPKEIGTKLGLKLWTLYRSLNRSLDRLEELLSEE